MKGRLTKRQMILLETLDMNPDIDSLELCKVAGYTRRENITSKITILKKKGYLRGKIYDLNVAALARNPIDRIIVFFEFDLDWSLVLGVLKTISCWKWVYPLEEGIHKQVAIMFYSTNESALLAIFDYLCTKGILHDYAAFRIVGEPQRCGARFCGKSESPRLENLLKDCSLAEPQQTTPTRFNRVDLNLAMYLQDGHLDCSVKRIAEHFEKNLGFKADYRTQWLKSFQKLRKKRIAIPQWIVFPRSLWECRAFLLLLRGDDGECTKRIFHNFARNERIYVWKALVVGLAAGAMREKAFDGLYSFFICHSDTTFYQKVVGYLDEYYPHLSSIKRFSIRQFNPDECVKRISPEMLTKPTNWWDGGDTSQMDMTEIPNYAETMAINLEEDVYDLQTQMLFYPYDEYRKTIEGIIERSRGSIPPLPTHAREICSTSPGPDGEEV